MTFTPTFLLPDPHHLQLEAVEINTAEHILALMLISTQPTTTCPVCATPTSRIHSRYTRHIADLPWADWPVRIHLQVRKFFCDIPTCPRRIFTERLSTIIRPWARRTIRLATAQRQLGLVAGGVAGARLSTTLAMPLGDDTVLALVRATILPESGAPQIIGVDDWARRKGQTYSTILVDHEAARPIDLLPDRSAEAFAHWLQAHPSVRVITRDRGGVYAEGAKNGAPSAVQVADRWHIIKNLGDALLAVFLQQHRVLEQAFGGASWPTTHSASLPEEVASTAASSVSVPEVSVPQLFTRREQERQQRMAVKQARHTQVRDLHQLGWSLHAIAAHTGLDRKTVRKYTRLPTLPVDARGQRNSILEPYKPYILERWNVGCRNAMQLLREIQPLGYPGQRSILRGYLTQLRKAQGLPTRSRNVPPGTAPVSVERKPPTLRTLTWLVLRREEKLDVLERDAVSRAERADEELASAIALAQDFVTMVRGRKHTALDEWLARAAASGSAALRNFAKSLCQDEAAIRAALMLPYSNGAVEGHINRLKLLKRQGYGRAKLDLLRIRLLAA